MRWRPGLSPRACLAPALTCLLGLSSVGPAFAQRDGRAKSDAPPSGTSAEAKLKGSSPQERAAGVIVKVEKVREGTTPGSTLERRAKAGEQVPVSLRLTINTAAVWRDWARDQAAMNDTGPAAKDARRGKNSVATQGEPQEQNSLVVVDLGAETRVETRFRASDDETTRGSRTPEAARTGPATGSGSGKTSRSAKPVQFRREDLKPGLFVEAEFRHVTAQNPASSVYVIRPIGGPDTAAPAPGGRSR